MLLTGTFSLLLVVFNWLVGDFTLLLCTVVFLSSLVLEATRLVCTAAAVGSGGLAIGLISRSSAQCVLGLTSTTSGPHFRPLCFAWLLVPILDALTVLVVLAAHLLDVLLVCTGDGAFERVIDQSISAETMSNKFGTVASKWRIYLGGFARERRRSFSEGASQLLQQRHSSRLGRENVRTLHLRPNRG